MLQSEDSMRPPVDFVSTVALKGLGMVLAHALNRLHVRNAQGADKVQDGRRPNPPNNKESNDKGDKPPATPHPASNEGANTGQTTTTNSGKPEPIPISSAGLSTTETQVLLNVVPVIITAENGNTVSTYAFLDSGCKDTLIDRGLVDHLAIQRIPERIGINTITNSGKVIESNRVSFTSSSVESFGESIEVSESYVLPDLNQSQRALPSKLMSTITLTCVTLSSSS